MRSRTLAICLPALFAAALAVQAERPRVYAITDATIVAAPGTSLEGATLVLRDGLIEAIGAGVAVPPDAEEIDGGGLWVYPGLIDAYTDLGLADDESSGRPSGGRGSPFGGRSQRSQPKGPVHPLAGVRPETRARDELQPFPDDGGDAEDYRKQGFTTVLVAPQQGVFRGNSVVIQLRDGTPVAELILRDNAAQHLGFSRVGFGRGYPTSLMGAAAAIRQTLFDARRYRTWDARYRAEPAGMSRPERMAAHEALRPLLAREQRAVFDADSAGDALLALRLASEFNLDPLIAASGEEWEVAERLRGVRLIYPVAFPDKPKVDEDDDALDASVRELRRFLDAPAGPARLLEAGAELALTTHGLKNLADLSKNMREMLDAGLDADAALAAWTTTPARFLEIERVTGTLEPGKLGNVLVLDGPLFGEETKLKRVFVDGHEFKMKEKKKPAGDPDAVIDPRGEWAVVIEFGSTTMNRTWTIAGEKDAYTGTAETREGTVDLESVTVEGNVMTVVFPARGGRGPTEISVIVEGDSFKGEFEMGPRIAPVSGTRTSKPEGGAR